MHLATACVRRRHLVPAHRCIVSQAFVDYIVYLILVSPIYSVVFYSRRVNHHHGTQLLRVNLARDTHRVARPARPTALTVSHNPTGPCRGTSPARARARRAGLVLPGPSGTANRG